MSLVRDVVLVARFEVLRAVRTWRALALFLLYAVATTGASWLFTRLVWALERSLAREMGVPETEIPGAMMKELMASDAFRSMLSAMVGTDAAVERLLDVPVLALFNLWFGFVLVPFFAASTSAESLAIDVQSRALRYEALRTGRVELVVGRALGQVLLTGAATFLSVVGVWAVGLNLMRGNDPVDLLFWLSWLSLRAWCFSLPFVGLGMAASQWTTSPAWARVMAVSATAGTWVAYGAARWGAGHGYGTVADLTLQLLPQGWIAVFWQPDAWPLAALVCATLGALATALGFVRFARRDL